MNIYAAAKKSFFSKLFVFVMAATLSLSALVPTLASAQLISRKQAPLLGGNLKAPSGNPPPGWKVRSYETAVEKTEGKAWIPDFIYEETSYVKMSFLRAPGTHTYGSSEFAGKGLEQGYVADRMAEIIKNETGFEFDPEKIFAIGTKTADGVDVTNYYVGDKLIASARANSGLFIAPAGGVPKLGSDPATDTDTNINTEAGFNNFMDGPKANTANSTNNAIRGSDSGNVYKLTQQQVTLEKQLDELNKKIAATTDPVERAQLERDREALRVKIDENRQTLESAKASGNSVIDKSACEEHWYSVISIGCMTALVAVLANMYLKLVAYALALVGTLFDYSIEIAVNSAEFVQRIGVVEPIWSFLRDMLNMTFIFILLWIAANIILGKKNYSIRSNVVKVVIVAVLINFSLFASKLLIDASNLLTLQIYQATKSGDPSSVHPVSGYIMEVMGMPTMYNFGDVGSNTTIKGCGGANGTIITVAIFGSIFMIILGFAFLLGAVLFFSRMANIMYLFITSPFWVWGYIMDAGFFKEVRESWKKKMTQAVKFPVVYMLFIFVGLFAFTKLVGLRTNQKLSFLTLLCVSEDKSLLGQLPIIMNFCLVIWVMLQAVRYGVKNGAGSEGSSLGFTKKFNDSVSKRFGQWAENTWKKPRDFALGKGKAAVGGISTTGKAIARYGVSGTSNYIAKKAGQIAASNAPDSIRNLASRIAVTTKDPEIFGKTQKKAMEDWKKNLTAKPIGTTERTLGVALDAVGDAPKFDPDKDSTKADMEKKVEEFAQKMSRVFFKKRILDDNGNREKILAAARDGIKEEKDSDGNISYKFDQALMRQKIADIRKAHMPGNDKGNRVHKSGSILNPYDLLFTARSEARNKVTTDRANTILKQTKTENSSADLKSNLKKHEEDLKKYPTNMEQLNTMLKDKPESLKGIAAIKTLEANQKDLEAKQKQLEKLTTTVEVVDEFGGVTRDYDAIARVKADIENKKENIEKAKQAILNQRTKIQNSINSINKQLEPKDNKDNKDNKGGAK